VTKRFNIQNTSGVLANIDSGASKKGLNQEVLSGLSEMLLT